MILSYILVERRVGERLVMFGGLRWGGEKDLRRECTLHWGWLVGWSRVWFGYREEKSFVGLSKGMRGEMLMYRGHPYLFYLFEDTDTRHRTKMMGNAGFACW
jgi:hypothetical protein